MEIPPQSGTAVPTTVWLFTDLVGTVMSTGSMDATGTWTIQQQQFSTTGVPQTTLGDTTNSALNQVPDIWKGGELELGQTSRPLYMINGRWFDPNQNRFLTAGPVTANSPNPYTLNGNNPVNSAGSIDWSQVQGDNPEGYDWFDTLFLNPTAKFSTGLATVATFGFSNGWQRSLYGDELADLNQSGVAYYAGIGVGIAFGLKLVPLSTAGYFGRAAYVARGVQAWAIAGDVVAVGQSSYHLATGQFSPMDLLGFLPTVGWGLGAFSRLRSGTIAVRDIVRAIQVGGVKTPTIGFIGRWKLWWENRALIGLLKKGDVSINSVGISRTKAAIFGKIGDLTAGSGNEIALLRTKQGLVLRMGTASELSLRGATRVIGHAAQDDTHGNHLDRDSVVRIERQHVVLDRRITRLLESERAVWWQRIEFKPTVFVSRPIATNRWIPVSIRKIDLHTVQGVTCTIGDSPDDSVRATV